MRPGTIMQISVQRMVCTGCGAEANASCDCGKPYIPAKKRAAEAIAANPHKSDRAIASDLGVSHETVSKARREAPVNELTPEREGRDGKVYRLPVKERAEPSPQQESLDSLLTLVDLSLRVSDVDFSHIKPTPEIRAAVRRVIEAWTQIEGALQ